MSNFSARTRLLGEVSYYRAAWIDNCFGDGIYGVRFEEGPHAGKVYPAKKCKIAKKENQRWSPINSTIIKE